jgi:hypothetical protein
MKRFLEGRLEHCKYFARGVSPPEKERKQPMTNPPQRRLHESLFWSAVVIAVTTLAAVILWAGTGWLWLVVHEGLH